MNTPSDNPLMNGLLADLDELQILTKEEAKDFINRWLEGELEANHFLLDQVIPPAQILIALVKIAGMKPAEGYPHPEFQECQTFMYFFCFPKQRSLELALHIAHQMSYDDFADKDFFSN